MSRFCIVAIIVTNEQIASSIQQTPEVIRASLKDVESFLRDAQRQIKYNVQDATDTAVERIKENLESKVQLCNSVQNT